MFAVLRVGKRAKSTLTVDATPKLAPCFPLEAQLSLLGALQLSLPTQRETLHEGHSACGLDRSSSLLL